MSESTISDTKLFEKLVKEFHTTFEFPVYANPDQAPFETHKLRSSLIKEESDEYCKARNAADRLDAICDLIYVIAGTAVTYSIDIDPYSSRIPLDFYPPSIPTSCRYICNDLDSLFPCAKYLTGGINTALEHLCDTARINNYRLVPAFIAVHINNLKKLWSEPPKDKNLKAVKKGDLYLVKNHLGKVIKSPDHVKVDLSTFV